VFCAYTSLDLLTFYSWLRIPNTLPFLCLPNANLNSDFRKYIAFGVVSTPQPRVLIQATQKRYALVCRANSSLSALGHRQYIFPLKITDDTTLHGQLPWISNCKNELRVDPCKPGDCICGRSEPTYDGDILPNYLNLTPYGIHSNEICNVTVGTHCIKFQTAYDDRTPMFLL